MKYAGIFDDLQEQRNCELEYQTIPDVLSEEECLGVIAMSSNLSMVESRHRWGEDNKNSRDTDIFWIFPNKENVWLFQKVASAVGRLNREFFGFSLDGSVFEFQLGRYRANQGYDWHCDLGKSVSRRKLSVSVQLTHPSEYDGGQLQFFKAGLELASAANPLGSVTVFPSFLFHRVTKLTHGERWSLVTWLEGPPFR